MTSCIRSAASVNMPVNPASKEVLRYSAALAAGLASIQARLEPNKVGLRNLPLFDVLAGANMRGEAQ